MCGTTESMEHILTNCQATPRRLIWSLTEDLWPHEQDLWPVISIGTILGCGSITPPNQERQENLDKGERPHQRRKMQGVGHLLQILLSEVAHLIWALRCKRVIGNPDHAHNDREIRMHWLRAINTRLTEDKIIATKIKCDDQTIRLVKATWEPILNQFMDTPNDWIHNREVLVGRRT